MTEQRLTSSEKIIIGVLAGACFLLHLITNLNGAYGFFRDELYYIACSDHLSFGYVDQPPFSLFLLKLSRVIFGDSLTAIRLVPSLSHALTIVVTGMIVKEMGGKSFAIFLAGLAVFTSFINTGMSLIYSMNAIDIFIWAIAIYLLLRIINSEEKKYWVLLGLVLGIGLLNKISVLFLGAGIFVGLILTHRQSFATRWPYLAGVIAFLIFNPYIIWNATHDWAHLEFIHRASAGKYSGRTYLDFINEQILLPNPIALPLWLGGLFTLFFYAPLKKFRILGWVYITAFLILFLNRTSKGEYLAPAYSMLFAAGAIWIEQKLANSWQKVVRYSYAGLLLISFTFFLPLILPVLSVPDYIAYAKKIGMAPTSAENKQLAELPQFYADMFGWKEKARDVAKAFQTLSPEDQAKCAIYSDNYGRCGAIDFFGKEYNLPKSVGSHNNYWWWGTREYTGEVVLILGGDLEDHKDDFESCEQVGVSTCQYCMPYENNVKIFIGRKLKASIKDAWPSTRHYD